MKNVLLRAVGLALFIGAMALTNATISAYAAGTGQTRTPIDRKTTESQIDALSNNLLRSTVEDSSVSRNEAEAFFVGFAMTRAMYYSADALNNRQFVPEATRVLTDLIDFVKGYPEERPLREALEMLKSGRGNMQQLLPLFDAAIDAYSADLRGTQPWYFYTGMLLTQIRFSLADEDESALQADLKLLQQLLTSAPQSAPVGLLNPMRAIARFAHQGTFSESDYVAISDNLGSVADAVFS